MVKHYFLKKSFSLKVLYIWLVSFLFVGCSATRVVTLPFDVADVAITTTSKAVGLASKVATTTVDVGSKVIDYSKPDTPNININID